MNNNFITNLQKMTMEQLNQCITEQDLTFEELEALKKDSGILNKTKKLGNLFVNGFLLALTAYPFYKLKGGN